MNEIDETPPDWTNPPCPACFAFQVEKVDAPPTTREAYVGDVQNAFAAGMAAGYLHCRMRSGPWDYLCRAHLQAMQGVIDAVCETNRLPRAEVYADFGIPMPVKVLQ